MLKQNIGFFAWRVFNDVKRFKHFGLDCLALRESVPFLFFMFALHCVALNQFTIILYSVQHAIFKRSTDVHLGQK